MLELLKAFPNYDKTKTEYLNKLLKKDWSHEDIKDSLVNQITKDW